MDTWSRDLPFSIRIATLGFMGLGRQGTFIQRSFVAIMALVLNVVCPSLLAQQAPASATRDPLVSHQAAYAECMNLARNAPERALGHAHAWERRGGNEGARHCRAVALLNTGAYAEAARQLEALAATIRKSGKQLKAELIAQAGQAWLISGSPDQALNAQTRALDLVGRKPELLMDRAITLASIAEYWRAIDDLNDLIDANARQHVALMLRATAWRKLGNLDLALDDIERAIAMAPGNADALLERGNIRALSGDTQGASDDWQAAIAAGPKSRASNAARENIAKQKAR